MKKAKLYLVAYDIKHPKRLSQVHHLVLDYAVGGQKSAFECYLTESQLKTLVSSIKASINFEDDQVFLIPINSKKMLTLGCAIPPKNLDFFYIG